MAAGVYDFELKQGASWALVVAWTIDGTTPVDLTGWTAAMQIREYKGATDPLVSATCTIPTPANGQITVALTRQQTAALPARTPLVYDLVVTNGTQGQRLIEGQITLDRAVTVVA